jgi:membrane associated rhomboid family serine protease
MSWMQGFRRVTTPVVRRLIIINLVVWAVFQLIIERIFHVSFTGIFALRPSMALYDWAIWQPWTYMFLHAKELTHILFNMLMLWFLGCELEGRWGSRLFTFFYLMSGFGAAIIYCLGVAVYVMTTGNAEPLMVPVVGASGAIFGIMLAYGVLFGERELFFMGLFPMKAKVFVVLLGAIEVLSMLAAGGVGGEVANLAHLGGLASGWILLHGIRFYQQRQWKEKAKKKTSNLRLVVDNDSKNETKKDNNPRYWN